MRYLILIAAALLALTGCGDEGEISAAENQPVPAEADAVTTGDSPAGEALPTAALAEDEPAIATPTSEARTATATTAATATPETAATRTPAPTNTPEKPRLTITSNANIRTCPQLDCIVTDTAQAGAVLQNARPVEGDWVQGSSLWYAFDNGGAVHYIHSSLVAAEQGTP